MVKLSYDYDELLPWLRTTNNGTRRLYGMKIGLWSELLVKCWLNADYRVFSYVRGKITCQERRVRRVMFGVG